MDFFDQMRRQDKLAEINEDSVKLYQQAQDIQSVLDGVSSMRSVCERYQKERLDSQILKTIWYEKGIVVPGEEDYDESFASFIYGWK